MLSFKLNLFVCSLVASETHFCFPPPSQLIAALRHFERWDFVVLAEERKL